MSTSKSNFLEIPAIKVSQPLGDFYVVKFQAKDLLDISFSEPLKYTDEFGNVQGSQREKKVPRLKEIAKYVDSVEMAFPNTIILAANYTQIGTISKDESERWKIIEDKNCGIHKLKIPKKVKLAAIIDGQHRLNAFEYVKRPERFSDLQLICSVYLDLPNSYQAFLFATINSNQKRVDRSLALEQFGFNVGDEEAKAWTPEKLAVFLTRRLNLDKEHSPFYKHIKVAPLNAEVLFADGIATGEDWVVSTATVVDGILSLFTSNPKRDRIEMQQYTVFRGRSRSLLKEIKDLSPLRQLFINGKDNDIYNIIKLFFKSISKHLWDNASKSSYIFKTVGVQATFDLLKAILKREKDHNPLDINFDNYIEKASGIDFSDRYFQASGIGRSRIKKVLGISTGAIEYKKLNERETEIIYQIINNSEHDIDEQSPGVVEAEKLIANTLEKAEWNIKSKSVRLYIESNYKDFITFDDYRAFFDKLVEMANQEFTAYLSRNHEKRELIKKQFNVEELVERYLDDYSEQLKDIGWQ